MSDAVVETFEANPLSSILSTNAEPAKAPPPAKVEQPKPAETPPAEAAKGDQPGETPSPDAAAQKTDAPKPEAAKKDDPIKVMRQALKATQRELAQLRQASEAKQTAPPDPISDPEAYRQSIENAVSDSVFRSRCADSEDDLREQLVKEHGSDDAYEEAMQAFEEMVHKDPSLAGQLRQSRKPAKFMYETVQKAKLAQEMGDPRQFAEKIRAETRAEMEAKVKELVAEGIKAALGQRLPQSLADEQTQGVRSDPVLSDFAPKPIGDILNKRK